MGIIRRLLGAFTAFGGRSKIGALQGGLVFNLKSSGPASPRSQQLMVDIAATAWKIPVVGSFFQSLGFSFADYEIMYRSAVEACPNVLIQDRNLIATFMLIDNCHELRSGLQAIAGSLTDATGPARASALSSRIASTAIDIAKSYPGGVSQQ